MSDQPDSQEMVLDEFLLSTTRSFDEAQAVKEQVQVLK